MYMYTCIHICIQACYCFTYVIVDVKTELILFYSLVVVIESID
jgi:hypothetical protein